MESKFQRKNVGELVEQNDSITVHRFVVAAICQTKKSACLQKAIESRLSSEGESSHLNAFNYLWSIVGIHTGVKSDKTNYT